jgi:hypothetical protein
MPFNALTFTATLFYPHVPRSWSPLFFPFDPDLPLFPLQYFHVLPNDLSGRRPGFEDRAYGYIRSIHIDIQSHTLTAEIVLNKDLAASQENARFGQVVHEVVADRLGVSNPVTLNDLTGLFAAGSPYATVNPVMVELWHRVVGYAYGGQLPFGRLWDPVLGLSRYYASWYSPRGGRKAELIETHYFVTHFGENVQSSGGVPYVEFHLLPTWEELTDESNPLPLFPRFRQLMAATTAVCSLPIFAAYDLSNWSYTGMTLGKWDTRYFMDHIVGAVADQHRSTLIECFNAFNKGPQRPILFMMMLNDLRQLHVTAPTPAGAHNPRINPAMLTAADVADVFLNMAHWQSNKVVSIYGQQCHGNVNCFPIDTWIASFLDWPLAVADYSPNTGQLSGRAANYRAVAAFIAAANQLGKAERLLWVTAQARKIHSPACNDALWCVKKSGDFAARGANPLSCKACNATIRAICPAHLEILGRTVRFNGTVPRGGFNIETSAGNNVAHGQRFLRSTDSAGTADEFTVVDAPDAFAPFPSPSHNGADMTVADFIRTY